MKLDGAAGNMLAPSGFGWGGLTGDQVDAGLIAPPPFPGDRANGLEMVAMSSIGPPPFEVYFSLAPGNSLGVSPGHILAVGGIYGTTPIVFLTSGQLGIPAGTPVNIDALSLEVTPTSIAVEYSVTQPSATGFPVGPTSVTSGADIIYSNGAGAGFVAHRPIDFGLAGASDDIDGLETTCVADLNGDGAVNAADLAVQLGAWGTYSCPPYEIADLNRDCTVNAADLAILLGSWGCP